MFIRTAKTKRLFIILLFLFPAAVFSQVKNYVGIVREKYYPESVSMLEEYRELLQSKGYTSYAKAVDSYLKGGFGSGFVYVAPDGTNYIITNRHVVSQAETVSIEFEGDNGGTTKYDNLKVLNADEEIDLAILSFPKGINPFKTGLSFSSKPASDGQDVWTAGFPGLAGEPLWQLGKGSVTNASARIKDLVDPDITALIQHSAQIDGGNSGGPLLITDKTAETGYAVLGVNTWKYRGRQDTNYSIPSAAVQAYIKKVLNPETLSAVKEQAEMRVRDFVADAAKQDNDFTDIVKYISYSYVASEGKDAFMKALSSAPSAVRSVVVAVFNNYSPIEGMRYALAWDIWQKLGKNEERSLVSAGEVTEVSSVVCTAPIKSEKFENPVETRWIPEQGLWRLERFGEVKEKDEDGKQGKKTGKKSSSDNSDAPFFGFESPYASAVQAGFDASLSKDAKSGFCASYTYFADFNGLDARWIGIGLGLSADKVNFVSEKDYVFVKISDANRFIMGPLLTVQVPMSIGKAYVLPYISGFLGFNWAGFGSFDNKTPQGVAASFEGGVKGGYDFGADINVFLGLGYRRMSQKASSFGKGMAVEKNSLIISAILVF
ncbi:serine protease [Treponema sp. HNW]|uniref:S1 family peptidase n=1 Tax=Treponema sp. HNW TaxID=3116654 RepID=UPI003D0BF737